MAKEITSIKEQKKIIMGIIEPCRRPYKRKSVSILELMKESMKRGIPAFDTMEVIVKLMENPLYHDTMFLIWSPGARKGRKLSIMLRWRYGKNRQRLG